MIELFGDELPALRVLSARLGQDPLQVQGPGGNTSIKSVADNIMWIKGTGTELAHAEARDIFVAVDLQSARDEAKNGIDGQPSTIRRLDPASPLRSSIETTFHAVIDSPVVAHTHSVATITHAISPQGRKAAEEKLAGLPFTLIPFAKPGLRLTRNILEAMKPDTRVFILENHGLICCGDSVAGVSDLLAEVESRLALPPSNEITDTSSLPDCEPGYHWSPMSWMALDERITGLATRGSYYPDHVVFLGPALPTDTVEAAPVVMRPGIGVMVRDDALPVHKAMLGCLADVLSRLPAGWRAQAIGSAAEAELMNWDAEKLRQQMAKQK